MPLFFESALRPPPKHQRSTNTLAVSDLAGSITLMSSSGALETLQCHTAAIKVAVHDENLNWEECIQVLSLFHHDIAASVGFEVLFLVYHFTLQSIGGKIL